MDITCYTGLPIADILQNPLQKNIYRYNWTQLHANYGDNVDFQRLQHQVLLCEETKALLYTGEPSPLRYRKGSRPVLEKTVADVCGKAEKGAEKVLALMCFCRDLYQKHDNRQLFYGGTEEELIKKGERLCECLARLMTALCEVAGIPSRIVSHVCGGHFTNEVYVDGGWHWLDPRAGLFYLDNSGNPASVADILKDTSIIYRQPDFVKKYASPLWPWEKRAEMNATKYFHPLEVITLCDYSLADSEQYSFEWLSEEKATENGLYVINQKYERDSNLLFGTGANGK